MKLVYDCDQKQKNYAIREDVVAVRNNPEFAEVHHFSLSERIGRANKFSTLDLPAHLVTQQKKFARSGWAFVDALPQLVHAAKTRDKLPGGLTAALVIVTDEGEVLLTTDLLTVQLDEDLSEAEASQRLAEDKLTVVRRLGFGANLFEVRILPGPLLTDVVSSLQSRDYYRFVEPELLQVIPGRVQPNDPHFNDQWQHNDHSVGGNAGFGICSEAAWVHTLGTDSQGRPMRIAVIDHGAEINHPDLEANIAGGGYFDQIDEHFIRLGAGPFPSGSHGTFCMGMAAARSDNARGGCGSAPKAALLAIACLMDEVGTQATLARAVAYAAVPKLEDCSSNAPGADVISCSLGLSVSWSICNTFYLAIKFAGEKGRDGLGCPILWAVSNETGPLVHDEVCSHPNVIAVGKSRSDGKAVGGAFGPRLCFLAPGNHVYSTTSQHGYGFDSGTSFAAPLAAGVAALVLARHPEWTAEQVRQRLIASCEKIGGVTYDANNHHDKYGYGLINAAEAVK